MPSGPMQTYLHVCIRPLHCRTQRESWTFGSGSPQNADQFQGARHELFAEATCLRAGSILNMEDETDPAFRQC